MCVSTQNRGKAIGCQQIGKTAIMYFSLESANLTDSIRSAAFSVLADYDAASAEATQFSWLSLNSSDNTEGKGSAYATCNDCVLLDCPGLDGRSLRVGPTTNEQRERSKEEGPE